jgi:hypothetical protein
MQQRITLAGCPVVEPDRQQPLSVHMLMAAMAAARPQVLIQVRGRLGDAGVMRLEHGPAGHRIPEAVQDRDALARPQDHVERRHGALAVGAAEKLAGVGVAALEHGLELGHGCFALQPLAAGAGAVPPAWTLAVARQIRLVVGGQLAGVVLLPPNRELGDVGHHPAPSLLAVVGASNAPVVHCSPLDDFGSSVERTATLHPLWQLRCGWPKDSA